MEKYVEEVKQEQIDVRECEESIMKAPGLVKQKLRLILFKLNQSRPKITKIKVSIFWTSREFPDLVNVASELVILLPSHAFFAIFGPASGHIFGKTLVLASLG